MCFGFFLPCWSQILTSKLCFESKTNSSGHSEMVPDLSREKIRCRINRGCFNWLEGTPIPITTCTLEHFLILHVPVFHLIFLKSLVRNYECLSNSWKVIKITNLCTSQSTCSSFLTAFLS